MHDTASPTLPQQDIDALAQRHGFSAAAVASMLSAVASGRGTMAQFDHTEFSGAGQWMRGGMTMVSDMFNHGLKSRVDALCTDLAALLANRPAEAPAEASLQIPAAPSAWWPSALGQPSSTGAQNSVRYAYFPQARRLAIDLHGTVTVYDTQDHLIGGFSQQQSVGGSLSFTSQHGLVRIAELPVVSA